MDKASEPLTNKAVLVGVAVVMMLAANFLFSVVDTSSKWLIGSGIVAVQLAFMRYLVQCILTITDIARRGTDVLSGLRPNFWLLVLRASFLIVSTLFNFIALRYLSLTQTSALMFTAPIIVCALSYPLLGERVGWVRMLFILLGFAGVVVIVGPFGGELNAAALLMLIPATGLALYSIMTRKLAGEVNPAAMQLVLGVLGTMVFLPFAWAFWVAPEGVLEIILMIGLGLFAWAGHELLIRAHKRADASFLMPFTYSYLIYMTFFGLLIFADVPDAKTIFGALMIAVSGLLIWARENYRSP